MRAGLVTLLIPGVSLSWDAKTGMIRVSPLGTLMLFR
jgi:hypothetical protein